MSEHDAGDTQKLFLTLRYVSAVVAEHGVVAVFKVHDKVVDMRGFCCGDNFLVGCVGTAVGDIFPDGTVFKPGVLQHHAVV